MKFTDVRYKTLSLLINFSGVIKHLYNWLCSLVVQWVGWSVTHLFDKPHVAPIGLLGLVLFPIVLAKTEIYLR